MRDQEVHGDVLAVYILVHHVPDGLGHHVGVQVGVVLQESATRGACELRQQKDLIWLVGVVYLRGFRGLTLWKKAAPVRTMESSQE